MKGLLRKIGLGLGLAVIVGNFATAQAASNTDFQLSILEEQCYIDLVEGGGDPYIFVQPEDCPGPPTTEVPLPPITVPPGQGSFVPDDINQIPVQPDDLPPVPEPPEAPATPQESPRPGNSWRLFLIVVGVVIAILLILVALWLIWGVLRRRSKDSQE